MPAPLMTVATFTDPVVATMTKNYLENEGIPAILTDETTVATAWMLSNAMGGIKLQVSSYHLERAELLLEHMAGKAQPEDEEPVPECAFATSETARSLRARQQEIDEDRQAEQIEEAPCNQAVDRLYRATIFGLIFFPLQLYALWLLPGALGNFAEISADRRWKLGLSILLNIPIMGSFLLLLSCLWRF